VSISKTLIKFRSKFNKYIVIFCVREGNYYDFLREVHIQPNQKSIKYDKENEFDIDIDNPTFRKRNILYYCIDINSQQIDFKHIQLEQLEESEYVSPKVNKMIRSDNIILQLAKATTTPIKQTYDYRALIFGIIMGCLGGIVIGFPIGFLLI